MRIVKVLLLAVGLLVVLTAFCFLAAGLWIPAERSFTNEIEIKAPAEKVWEVVNDRSKYTEWQTNLERVEVINERDHMGGPFWIEYPKDSPQPLKFWEQKDERPARMEFEYSMSQYFQGSWKGEIMPTEKGVRLRTVDSYRTEDWMTKIMIYAFSTWISSRKIGMEN
jgi:uncharacterized protein YndB with AHSA1/START domain